MATFLYRLGHLAVRRRRSVLLLWIAVAVGVGVWSAAAGGTTTESFSIPGTESQDAFDLLEERLPEASGSSTLLVFATDGDVRAPATMAAIARVVDEVAGVGGVSGVIPPSASGAFSPDGHVALAQVRYPVAGFDVDERTIDAVADAVARARGDALRVELGGEVVPDRRPQPQQSEGIGLLVAMTVLLVSFGSVVAMGLPIVTALVGLGIALGGITVMAAHLDLSQDAPTMAIMIGLAVGIDYALFIVSRHRENLAEGLDVAEAAARANATAGGAVVFAGATVVIALAGLTVVGIPYVSSLGLAPAAAVSTAVLVAVSMLPALLGFAGRSIDRFRVPGSRNRPGAEQDTTLAARWARHVTGRPRTSLAAGLVLLAVLAIPVTGIRLGFPDAGHQSTDTTPRRAYDLVAASFGPGANGPLIVAADLRAADDDDAAARIAARLATVDGVAQVLPATHNDARDTAAITIIPTTGPADEATEALVHRLRGPGRDAIERATGARYYVTGSTAAMIDLSDKISDALVPFMAVVIGLTLLLLTAVFRSILVPIKAAVSIVASIGAAFGIVVAVFQWGWLAGLIGVDETLPIVSFVPLMMFAVLFGLSMDYEVFILTRIREEHMKSRDARESVLLGITASARVITAAALIMISVFGAFVLGDHVIIKMFGLGLAAAVLVDATIVRMVIVPAAMTLFGDRAWRLPRWLDRILPDLDVEGTRLTAMLQRRDTDARAGDAVVRVA